MRSILALLTFVFLFPVVLQATSVRADDGIPDNCEYAQSAEQRAIIPRYSASTQRLVLVNWTSGDEIQTLDRDVPVISILGWSGDCRYLAVAEGTLEVMNTVVYDTMTSQRMGSVDDAHHKPHPITWGINDNLVVETRHGAILWNVPTGQRFTLMTSFNTTTGRNFSRLRWDAANHQLIVDLAVGGRAVYDLTTGAVVPVAAQQSTSLAVNAFAPQVVIGGRAYSCFASYDSGYRNWYGGKGIPDVSLQYDSQNKLIFLQLNDIYGPEATILTLENNVETSGILKWNWSPTCHYIVAALGRVDQNVSDTVVYDVASGMRLGEVSDARSIPHPTQWAADGNSLLVQTRSGAILWNLVTNQQQTISDGAQVALAGNPNVRNFVASTWENGQLLAAPVNTPNTVILYDGNGVVQTSVSFAAPVTALQSASGGWAMAILGSASSRYERAVVFRPDSGAQIEVGSVLSGSLSFSTDNRYFAMTLRDGIGVWDTTTLAKVGQYLMQDLAGYRFVDGVSVRGVSGARLNVVTGAYTPADQAIDGPAVRAPISGADGQSFNPWEQYYTSNGRLGLEHCGPSLSAAYDATQRALIVNQNGAARTLVANLNTTDSVYWSPDCREITGHVYEVSNAQVPYDDAPLDDIYRDQLTYNLVIWDAATGATLATFPRPYRYDNSASLSWSPDGERAFIQTTQGYFIFDPSTQETIPLRYNGPTDERSQINTELNVFWDLAHGRVFTSAWGGALAFDLRTGERIAFLTPGGSGVYHEGCGYYGCSFDVSSDGRYLYVYGVYTIGQYDFQTLQGVQVNLGTAMSYGTSATSSDGHYLVHADAFVHVWDLTALPADVYQRTPARILGATGGYVRTMRFRDTTTLVITTGAGVTEWNVATGQKILEPVASS